MSYQDIIVERGSDRIWRVTLNRPAKLNAITVKMWDELVAAFHSIGADDEARCVVLTGAGRGFCSGRDLNEEAVTGQQPVDPAAFRKMQRSLIPVMVRCPAPVIAAVNGPAVGAGLSLALACDVRIAASEASFMVAFLRRGLVPDAGATFLLTRAVGYAKALELCLSDDMIGAEEALAIGLVNRVASAAAFASELDALAARFAALPIPVVRASKQLLLEAVALGLDAALDRESAVQPTVSATSGHLQAVAEFLDRQGGRGT